MTIRSVQLQQFVKLFVVNLVKSVGGLILMK